MANHDSDPMIDSAPLGCGVLTVKYLVFLFNLLFFVAGLVLIIIGAITQGFFKEYTQFFENEYTTPAIGIVILGVIILFISFFGCCGAKMESTCMLKTFSFLLGFLLLCEIAAAISIAVLKSDVEDVIIENMNKTMHEYSTDSDNLVTSAWDNIQQNLHCCGTYNYTDWKTTNMSNGTRVPDSCCMNVIENCGFDAFIDHSKIYTNGCSAALKDSALRNFGAIVGGAVGLAVVQIVGILMSMCLVRSLKLHYEIL